MPLINGEKFACQSCIKGHRVSGCTHTDRELQHINPKGRPVKQCEHCRGARKSKSHHAKCDCGEKKDKGKLKDRGDAKGEILADVDVDGVSNHAAVGENACCCHSGAKCICGLKSDIFDLKLDTGRHSLHGARTKPKLTSTHSESTLTVFANGHHKPCHRNNNTAHVSGAPYKIPRPHTLHGHAAFAACSQGNGFGRSESMPQRSADTLSVTNNDFHAIFGSTPREMGSPITPLTGTLDGNGIGDALFTAQGSAFAQDGNSPESQLEESVSTQQWPWTNSNTTLNRNFGFGSLSTSPSQDCLPSLENEWNIPSAGLNTNNSVWSAGDLPLDPNKLNDSLTQPISHSGESNKHSLPGLTTGSSTQSENGETAFIGDVEFRNPPSAVSDSLFWEDSPAHRLATSISSEVRTAPTSVPSVGAVEPQILDLDYSNQANEGSPFKSNIGFTPNSLAFSNSIDDVRGSKALINAPTTLTGSGQADGITAFSAISMPNTMDDIMPNDPWLLEPNTFGGLNSFDGTFQPWL
ncbi:uncharacterized protein BDR25DRAFT_265181 [Lindgomyces ingoldianus]|uniref:Uncharacterized protein n=1 Tax=Lindgomyces ingoldianus TaxID=673940 RepID=A0ACB6QQP3_9PLEO|nr:uncharacterized protein BDR25DRAFT_265181 [Lindgomyces ingoldianus]KAF2468486.1 hypothetical protein BDR25DRAFT_265181 [Lindgomyces ingoldianus]